MPREEFSVTLPTIYDKFQCKGGSCRNTCCQGWTISVTRGEYNKIRHRCKSEVTDTVFQRLSRKQAADEHYANVKITENGCCPFFDEKHLCGLQLEYGANILPLTCKQFPRLVSSSLDRDTQLCLDLGCERVLELLLECAPTGLHFQHDVRFLQNLRGYQIHDDGLLAEYHSDIRNLCIWLLQNRSYSLSDRMLLLGLCLQDLHEIEQSKESEKIPQWFIKWQSYTKGDALKEVISELHGNRHLFVVNNLKSITILSNINIDFKKYLPTVQNNISFTHDEHFSYNIEQYEELHKQFYACFPWLDDFLENYMIMVLFRMCFRFRDSSTVWSDYNYLCQIYSLMHFYLVVSAPQTTEALIDQLTTFSRSTISFNVFSDVTVKLTEQLQSDSLAHLAILVRES